MQKLLSVILSSCLLASGGAAPCDTKPADALTSGCKSAYLMESTTGECVYAENETARMPIASVCKVMTLTLVFDAVSAGKISLDDMVTVSENAAGMGGSQIFLQSGLSYPVNQLIKSIIVCSANDSCVALSEAVCGDESTFISQMNKKASELGCADTQFANCTGLPRETQYSCAKDVAVMFANLIKNEDYFKYSKIWLEDFAHPDNRTVSMTNTNKLIKKYALCDGGKTGFTNEAGFCLAATANKNDLRFISVVLGADSSDNRFKSTINLFNYGFANFKNKIVLDKDVTLNDEFYVRGGKDNWVAVRPERNCSIFTKADENPDVTYNVTSYDLKAPVIMDSVVGKIEVYKNGVLADTINIVAAENIEKANFFDNLKDIASEWAI